MNANNPLPQSLSALTVQSAQNGATLADDEVLVELLSAELAADIVDSITPHALDYVSSQSEAELQSMSTDVDGAVPNNEEIEDIADMVSDSLVEPLSDTLADVQTASLETSTSVVALQAAGGIQAQGFGRFLKKVGRGVKKAAKKVGGYLRENGKRILKDAAGFALRAAIGALSAQPSGLQQLGWGSLLRRGAKLAAPIVRKSFDWIKKKVKDKAKDVVREGLRRVHQIADEKIASLSAPAPADPAPAPDSSSAQAPWIAAQAITSLSANGGSFWKNPALA